MGRIKQTLSWWCYAREGIAPEKLCKEAARIGYKGIEMAPEDHWQLIRDSGLRIATIAGHTALDNGLNRAENHDRIEKELRDNIAKAKGNDIACLICFSGNRHGASDEEGIRVTAAGLKRVARDAEQAGVTLVVELLNSKVDHKGYQCDHTPWGVEVCKQVASDRVKLLYDIYHMQIMEGDLIRTIRDNIAYIGHFHTAGNPGRHEMDETQELYYPAIFRAIADTGYRGYVGHEFVPKGDVFESLETAYKQADV